jgi:hypothetical protein
MKSVIIVTEKNKVKKVVSAAGKVEVIHNKFIQVCKYDAGLREDFTPDNLIPDENAPDLDAGTFTSSDGATNVQFFIFPNSLIE